jgi:hypothetical protein
MMQACRLVSALLLLGTPALAQAQHVRVQPTNAIHHHHAVIASTVRLLQSPGIATQDSASRPSGLRPLRVAKWSVVVAAGGAGIYGFLQNNEADDRFRELERLCQQQQFRCAVRTERGEYADTEFEDLYQQVRRLDGRSHKALLFSQIGVAAGVALFLLDLANSDTPRDIPWVPANVEVEPVAGRIELSVGVPLSRE